MTVDFQLARAPKMTVATIRWTGPWSDARIHARFREVAKWARRQRLRTGRWVFREPAARTWEVGIEVRGAARSDRRVKIRTLPAASIGRIVFDPDVVSPRVIYHGLYDWLRTCKREGEIRAVGSYREVYSGDPWVERRAYARTEIQAVVRRA